MGPDLQWATSVAVQYDAAQLQEQLVQFESAPIAP